MIPGPDKNGYLYGVPWRDTSTAVGREIVCIQKGGAWIDEKGRTCGMGLFTHYRNLQTLLWPDYDHHRWSDLLLQSILDNRVTAILGPKDCGKTHGVAKFALSDYFCFPQETLALISSTDMRGLELRVWGELKDLFSKARDKWPGAPGNVLESMHGIFTDELVDGEPRDKRKGIICVPMKDSNGQWVGLSKYTGIKQKRRRLFGDEVQFYADSYVSTLANLNKGDFKCVVAGNPIGEGDPLDKLAEPEDGWDAAPESDVTVTWKNRQGGVTVNFVGLDSPGVTEPEKYPYLINQKDIDYIETYWGKESAEYYNQAKGVRRPSISLRRVLTRNKCLKFGAMDDPIWKGTPITKIYAVDAGYGGDRCVGGEAGFGLDLNGTQIIALSVPRIIPIRVYPKDTPKEQQQDPEEQIAEYVKADCDRLDIPPSNMGHDSTGRGALGTTLARVWSDQTIPIEFGGNPSPRPVSADLFIYDEKLKTKRLKRCDEHYIKRVSELHFSVRYAIEAGQLRGLSEAVMDELCRREWSREKGDKIKVESKEDTKERLGRSPDLADWCALVIEIARQKGFIIAKLDVGKNLKVAEGFQGWRQQLRDRAAAIKKNHSLNYAA